VLFLHAQFNTTEAYKKLLREILRVSPALTDAGWGGYGITGLAGNNNSIALFMGLPNATTADANKTVAPLSDYAASLSPGGTEVDFVLQPFNSFGAWYDFTFNNSFSEVGRSQEITSRLLSRSVLEEQVEKVTETFANLPGVTWKFVDALLASNSAYSQSGVA
jgi:hypothetical protein